MLNDCQVIRRITTVTIRPMSGSATRESERDEGRADDDGEADEAVGASVIAVGDERRALQPLPGAQPHPRGRLVADEADHAGGRKRPEVRQVCGLIRRSIDSTSATQALTKIVATTK